MKISLRQIKRDTRHCVSTNKKILSEISTALTAYTERDLIAQISL